MAGLAALGHFAGGLVKGYTNMSEEMRRKEDYEETRREREKKKQKEQIAAETLGQVGQREVVGASDDEAGNMPVLGEGTITQEQGLRNYASRIAGLDPLESVRMAGEADNIGMRGLQRRQAERTERTNTLNEQLSDLRRYIAAGGDPTEGYKKLWALNKDVPNGYSSSIFSFNGQPHISLQQDGSPEAQAYPLTNQTLMKAIDMFEKSLMPTKDRAALGLQERQVGVQERNANTNERYREDTVRHQGRMLDETIRHNQAREGLDAQRNRVLGAGQGRGHWQIVGTDKDGAAIAFDAYTGQLKRQDNKPIQDQSFFNKLTGNRPTPQVNPEIMKAMLDEYKTLPQMTPQLETAFRRKWGPAAEAVIGKDPMASAAASAFGGQPGQQPAGVRGPQAQSQQADPVIFELQQKIRDAAVQGDGEMVQRLQAGLQAYINGRGSQGGGLAPPKLFGGFGQYE